MSDFDKKDVHVAVRRTGKQIFYEVQLFCGQAISKGMGYCDSMIYDGDTLEREVSIKRVSRQDTDGKTNSPFQLGYVLMVDEQTRMGVLEGHLKWKGDSLGYPIDKIRISSRSNPSFWIREAVDTTGYYATQLP